MEVPQVVIDTSVLVSALRSRRGASYLLLTLIDSGRFQVHVSVPLFLEYEEVSKRLLGAIPLTEDELDAVLDYVCQVANHQPIFYLWRPFLRDADDDLVLEVAVAAGCSYLITFNEADFQGAEQFGIRVRTPREFLQEIGVLA